MTLKKNDSKNTSWTPYQLFLIVILLSLIFLFSLLGITCQKDKSNIVKLADETITFLEGVCQRYDNNKLDISADNQQNVYDKTLALRTYASSEQIKDTDYLSQYASEQHLTGILILNEQLGADNQATVSGKNIASLWISRIKSQHYDSIMDHTNKSFIDEVTLHDKTYDIAIVARTDARGLILGYKDTAKEETDRYAYSFDTLLTNNTFHKNPRIVITDSDHVLSTNVTGLESLTTVNDSPVFNHETSGMWPSDNLIRLKMYHRTWYGLRKVYGNYYIYVFYSANEVFSNMIPIVASAIAFYAILCIIMLLIRQHYQTLTTQKEQKQLRTIEAIATLYSSMALINLDDLTCEPIHLSPQLTELLKGHRNAQLMLDLILEDVVCEEYREGFMQYADLSSLAERIKGRDSLTYWYRSTSGVWYSSYIVPVHIDKNGNVSAVLIANRDISNYKNEEETYKETLRKTARDAELANDAKSGFLRRMSHDVRTPINGIRGMVAIARRHQDNPEELENCMQKILSSSNYLLDLVNDVLRMSKLESGKVILEEKPFNLTTIITETVSFIDIQAAEKQLHFHVAPIDVTHPYLIGSPLHVRQIIQNIMSNAVKYTPPGGSILIDCKEISSTTDTATFTFTCTDTGVGMSEEFQARAFEPFVQEDNTARTTYSGTGLGLSIVKDLVDLMNGQIHLESTKNVGTTFVITLRFLIDPSSASDTVESEDALFSIEGTKILIAEDNELNLEIARSLLAEEGAVITEAHNGLEALQLFRSSAPGTFDLILMDIMMPVMDGLEASRQIRNSDHPDASRIPIFAMTANSFVEDIQKSKEAGMNEHFVKPLDVPELVRVIFKYVGV